MIERPINLDRIKQAEIIRARRKALKLTQIDVNERANVDYRTYQRYETRGFIPPQVMDVLQVLGLEIKITPIEPA